MSVNRRSKTSNNELLCACGSGNSPASCCLPYIESAVRAPSASALMRSRYTAYTLNRTDYLLRTWHPSTRPAQVEIDVAVRWLGLKIKHISAGQPGDQEGTVEFIARFKTGSRANRIHEHSRFLSTNDGWQYVDGELKHQPRMRTGRKTSF